MFWQREFNNACEGVFEPSFLVTMFLQFNLMLLHTRVFFFTLDIKSFKDSQTVQLAKIDPLFHTSTF
jgi:hypothetical protein